MYNRFKRQVFFAKTGVFFFFLIGTEGCGNYSYHRPIISSCFLYICHVLVFLCTPFADTDLVVEQKVADAGSGEGKASDWDCETADAPASFCFVLFFWIRRRGKRLYFHVSRNEKGEMGWRADAAGAVLCLAPLLWKERSKAVASNHNLTCRCYVRYRAVIFWYAVHRCWLLFVAKMFLLWDNCTKTNWIITAFHYVPFQNI